VYANQGVSLETCSVWEGVSTPCLPKGLLALVAAVFVMYQVSATWPGGLWAVAVTVVLALPSASAEGAVFAGLVPGYLTGLVQATACALVVAHAVGFYPIISAQTAQTVKSNSHWQELAGLAVVATIVGAMADIGYGSAALSCAAITAVVALVLAVVFSSRPAPLLPSQDSFARHAAIVTVGWACACMLASKESTVNFVIIGGAAAVTMICWAVLQLLSERDGPFFSNGVRMVVVDLEVLAAVFAIGFVAIDYAATANGISLWGFVQPVFGLVAGSVAAGWAALPTSVTSVVCAWVCAPVQAFVSGQEAKVVAIVLFSTAMVLRRLVMSSSVPLPAHLSGEVAASGKGMRPVVGITVDGAGAAGAIELVQIMEENEDFTPITFFATRKEMAAHPDCLALIADCGHEVGLLLTEADILGATVESLTVLKDSLEELTGRRVRWARTVNGTSGAELTMALAHVGMTLVLWTSWPRDWASHPDTVAADVLAECTGFGRPAGAQGAVVRIVMDGSLVSSDADAGGSDQQERAFGAVVDIVTRLTEIEGLTIAALSDVIPHRGFELEA
jgi:hypothetical protein